MSPTHAPQHFTLILVEHCVRAPAGFQHRAGCGPCSRFGHIGPEGEWGVEELKQEGLLALDNEGLRRAYLDDVTPKLGEAGIDLRLERELPWERWNRLQRRLEP